MRDDKEEEIIFSPAFLTAKYAQEQEKGKKGGDSSKSPPRGQPPKSSGNFSGNRLGEILNGGVWDKTQTPAGAIKNIITHTENHEEDMDYLQELKPLRASELDRLKKGDFVVSKDVFFITRLGWFDVLKFKQSKKKNLTYKQIREQVDAMGDYELKYFIVSGLPLPEKPEDTSASELKAEDEVSDTKTLVPEPLSVEDAATAQEVVEKLSEEVIEEIVPTAAPVEEVVIDKSITDEIAVVSSRIAKKRNRALRDKLATQFRLEGISCASLLTVVVPSVPHGTMVEPLINFEERKAKREEELIKLQTTGNCLREYFYPTSTLGRFVDVVHLQEFCTQDGAIDKLDIKNSIIDVKLPEKPKVEKPAKKSEPKTPKSTKAKKGTKAKTKEGKKTQSKGKQPVNIRPSFRKALRKMLASIGLSVSENSDFLLRLVPLKDDFPKTEADRETLFAQMYVRRKEALSKLSERKGAHPSSDILIKVENGWLDVLGLYKQCALDIERYNNKEISDVPEYDMSQFVVNPDAEADKKEELPVINQPAVIPPGIQIVPTAASDPKVFLEEVTDGPPVGELSHCSFSFEGMLSPSDIARVREIFHAAHSVSKEIYRYEFTKK